MSDLPVFSADTVEDALPYPKLIERLRDAFREDIEVPLRHHHTVPTGGTDATLLIMPA